MLIEAVSAAKNPAAEDANEDALVILPGRAFAVIDGVSDRIGMRYDGMLAGRYAAHIVQRRLGVLLADGPLPTPDAIVADLTATIAAAYVRFGTAERVRTDFGCKIASTLALALLDAGTVTILLVGDSGIRLNGTTLIRLEKDLDRITSLLRREAWRVLAPRTADLSDRERLSRQIAFHGTAQDPAPLAPWLAPQDLAAIATATIAACRAEIPHLPEIATAALIEAGIVGGQGPHQNNPASPLGYSALDGFPIPPQFIRIARLPRAGVTTIELFSDGYFRPGDRFGVAAWEAAFRQVEAEDPHKIGPCLSPKGSTATMWSDDRTYLGVALSPAAPAASRPPATPPSPR
jgi:hypothetical protein